MVFDGVARCEEEVVVVAVEWMEENGDMATTPFIGNGLATLTFRPGLTEPQCSLEAPSMV